MSVLVSHRGSTSISINGNLLTIHKQKYLDSNFVLSYKAEFGLNLLAQKMNLS